MDPVLGSINHGSPTLAVLIIKCVHIKERKSSHCWELIKLQFHILAVAKQQHILLQTKYQF